MAKRAFWMNFPKRILLLKKKEESQSLLSPPSSGCREVQHKEAHAYSSYQTGWNCLTVSTSHQRGSWCWDEVNMHTRGNLNSNRWAF